MMIKSEAKIKILQQAGFFLCIKVKLESQVMYLALLMQFLLFLGILNVFDQVQRCDSLFMHHYLSKLYRCRRLAV